MPAEEKYAKGVLDHLLTRAGWVVCVPDKANITGEIEGAICGFPLKQGYRFADYLLYVKRAEHLRHSIFVKSFYRKLVWGSHQDAHSGQMVPQR